MATYLERSYEVCVYTGVFRFLKREPQEERLFQTLKASLTNEQRRLLAEIEKQEEMRFQVLHREIFEQGFHAGVRCRTLVDQGKLSKIEQFASF